MAQENDTRLVFKGGTMLRVCVFPGYRFSADIDFDWIGAPRAFSNVFNRSARNGNAEQRRRNVAVDRPALQLGSDLERRDKPGEHKSRGYLRVCLSYTHSVLGHPPEPSRCSARSSDTRLRTCHGNGRQTKLHFSQGGRSRLFDLENLIYWQA
ncbi:MAG: nucleotidyl transferase AbiEii/AbiGii toxin family protein [Acidimicrobiia bacterium]|nr:nucleotidyl transferase AbiEii/AbiGii toxin family protein [Acidimicrobiia bacterium]